MRITQPKHSSIRLYIYIQTQHRSYDDCDVTNGSIRSCPTIVLSVYTRYAYVCV